MKYIEVIVLINILIHFSFIRMSNFIMRRKNRWLPIILSILLDVVYVILYLLIPEKVESLKYIVILVLSILPFISKSLTTTLFNTIIYLMFNFILGGFSEIMMNIVNHYLLVLLCLVVINILFTLFAVYKKIHIKERKHLYDILVFDNKQKYEFKGFCDTGNLLVTDGNIPVVFINKKYKIGKYYKNMMVNTISGNKEIELFKIDKFMIKVNEKYVKRDVYISFVDIRWDVLFGEIL